MIQLKNAMLTWNPAYLGAPACEVVVHPVIPYISATTINRCIGARNKAGYQLQGWR